MYPPHRESRSSVSAIQRVEDQCIRHTESRGAVYPPHRESRSSVSATQSRGAVYLPHRESRSSVSATQESRSSGKSGAGGVRCPGGTTAIHWRAAESGRCCSGILPVLGRMPPLNVAHQGPTGCPVDTPAGWHSAPLRPAETRPQPASFPPEKQRWPGRDSWLPNDLTRLTAKI